MRVVLGGGAQHGRPADVDVLHALGEGRARARDGGAEGVQVAGHEVDGREAVAVEVRAVGGQVAPREDARVHGGMERLHAPVEHLRQARDLLDAGDGDARRLDGAARAAGGDELPSRARAGRGRVRRCRSCRGRRAGRAWRASVLPRGKRAAQASGHCAGFVRASPRCSACASRPNGDRVARTGARPRLIRAFDCAGPGDHRSPDSFGLGVRVQRPDG